MGKITEEAHYVHLQIITFYFRSEPAGSANGNHYYLVMTLSWTNFSSLVGVMQRSNCFYLGLC